MREPARSRGRVRRGTRRRSGPGPGRDEGDPLDQLTMPRLVASPLPGRALAVVHQPEEPARGSHGSDATAGGCLASSRGDARDSGRRFADARRLLSWCVSDWRADGCRYLLCECEWLWGRRPQPPRGRHSREKGPDDTRGPIDGVVESHLDGLRSGRHDRADGRPSSFYLLPHLQITGRSLTPMSAGSPPPWMSAALAGLTANGATSSLTKADSWSRRLGRSRR
jgi:hypothetical protein